LVIKGKKAKKEESERQLVHFAGLRGEERGGGGRKRGARLHEIEPKKKRTKRLVDSQKNRRGRKQKGFTFLKEEETRKRGWGRESPRAQRRMMPKKNED